MPLALLSGDKLQRGLNCVPLFAIFPSPTAAYSKIQGQKQDPCFPLPCTLSSPLQSPPRTPAPPHCGQKQAKSRISSSRGAAWRGKGGGTALCSDTGRAPGGGRATGSPLGPAAGRLREPRGGGGAAIPGSPQRRPAAGATFPPAAQRMRRSRLLATGERRRHRGAGPGG